MDASSQRHDFNTFKMLIKQAFHNCTSIAELDEARFDLVLNYEVNKNYKDTLAITKNVLPSMANRIAHI